MPSAPFTIPIEKYFGGRLYTQIQQEILDHNERVKNIIPPEKLLVFDVREGVGQARRVSWGVRAFSFHLYRVDRTICLRSVLILKNPSLMPTTQRRFRKIYYKG